MIGQRGRHLDDPTIARFVDEGERTDTLTTDQVRHLEVCSQCQRLVRGHRRARSLLLRADPASELPAVVPTGSPRLVPAFATLGVVVLAVAIGAGTMMRWNISGAIEPTPSQNAPVVANQTPTAVVATPSSVEPAPPSASSVPLVTPSPAAPPPTVEPSLPVAATPTASLSAVRYCASTDVRIAIVPQGSSTPPVFWTGGMGRRTATFVLTNVSSTPCLVPTFSTPELLNGDGKVLLEGGMVPGGGAKTVAPGARLTMRVETADLCGASPIVAPVTVGFRMMDGKNAVAPAGSPTDTEGVPPCTSNPSSTSGMISINGWTPA